MIFSKRLVLEKNYREWIKTTKIKDSAINVITFLDLSGMIAENDYGDNIRSNNRYDWSKAPEWAQWIATDADGTASWYEVEPIQSAHVWLNGVGGRPWVPEYQFNSECYKSTWRYSLESRPKG